MSAPIATHGFECPSTSSSIPTHGFECPRAVDVLVCRLRFVVMRAAQAVVALQSRSVVLYRRDTTITVKGDCS